MHVRMGLARSMRMPVSRYQPGAAQQVDVMQNFKRCAIADDPPALKQDAAIGYLFQTVQIVGRGNDGLRATAKRSDQVYDLTLALRVKGGRWFIEK